MCQYNSNAYFLNVLGIVLSINLFHISKIHAFLSKLIKKQEFQMLTD